jgi:AraC-like DNA-binding protein
MSPSIDLVEREAPARPEPTALQFEAVQRVTQAMRAEVDYPFTLDTIAEIANYSPFHFARLFREVIGIPPGEYLAAIRFERAKELILRTDLSVTDICFEVGFSSLGTFSSRFKHLVGASPAELRRLPELIDRHGPPCSQDPDRFQRLGAAATQISGTIHGEHSIDGHIYIGLFEDAIAQSLPVCGTRLNRTGAFVLPPAPNGTFWLMAAVLPASSDPLDQLLPDRSIQVASDRTPVTIGPGRPQSPRHLFLRPVRAIDSPILTALPPLAMNLPASLAH